MIVVLKSSSKKSSSNILICADEADMIRCMTVLIKRAKARIRHFAE